MVALKLTVTVFPLLITAITVLTVEGFSPTSDSNSGGFPAPDSKTFFEKIRKAHDESLEEDSVGSEENHRDNWTRRTGRKNEARGKVDERTLTPQFRQQIHERDRESSWESSFESPSFGSPGFDNFDRKSESREGTRRENRKEPSFSTFGSTYERPDERETFRRSQRGDEDKRPFIQFGSSEETYKRPERETFRESQDEEIPSFGSFGSSFPGFGSEEFDLKKTGFPTFKQSQAQAQDKTAEELDEPSPYTNLAATRSSYPDTFTVVPYKRPIRENDNFNSKFKHFPEKDDLKFRNFPQKVEKEDFKFQNFPQKKIEKEEKAEINFDPFPTISAVGGFENGAKPFEYKRSNYRKPIGAVFDKQPKKLLVKKVKRPVIRKSPVLPGSLGEIGQIFERLPEPQRFTGFSEDYQSSATERSSRYSATDGPSANFGFASYDPEDKQERESTFKSFPNSFNDEDNQTPKFKTLSKSFVEPTPDFKDFSKSFENVKPFEYEKSSFGNPIRDQEVNSLKSPGVKTEPKSFVEPTPDFAPFSKSFDSKPFESSFSKPELEETPDFRAFPKSFGQFERESVDEFESAPSTERYFRNTKAYSKPEYDYTAGYVHTSEPYFDVQKPTRKSSDPFFPPVNYKDDASGPNPVKRVPARNRTPKKSERKSDEKPLGSSSWERSQEKSSSWGRSDSPVSSALDQSSSSSSGFFGGNNFFELGSQLSGFTDDFESPWGKGKSPKPNKRRNDDEAPEGFPEFKVFPTAAYIDGATERKDDFVHSPSPPKTRGGFTPIFRASSSNNATPTIPTLPEKSSTSKPKPTQPSKRLRKNTRPTEPPVPTEYKNVKYQKKVITPPPKNKSIFPKKKNYFKKSSYRKQGNERRESFKNPEVIKEAKSEVKFKEDAVFEKKSPPSSWKDIVTKVEAEPKEKREKTNVYKSKPQKAFDSKPAVAKPGFISSWNSDYKRWINQEEQTTTTARPVKRWKPNFADSTERAKVKDIKKINKVQNIDDLSAPNARTTKLPPPVVNVDERANEGPRRQPPPPPPIDEDKLIPAHRKPFPTRRSQNRPPPQQEQRQKPFNQQRLEELRGTGTEKKPFKRPDEPKRRQDNIFNRGNNDRRRPPIPVGPPRKKSVNLAGITITITDVPRRRPVVNNFQGPGRPRKEQPRGSNNLRGGLLNKPRTSNQPQEQRGPNKPQEQRGPNKPQEQRRSNKPQEQRRPNKPQDQRDRNQPRSDPPKQRNSPNNSKQQQRDPQSPSQEPPHPPRPKIVTPLSNVRSAAGIFQNGLFQAKNNFKRILRNGQKARSDQKSDPIEVNAEQTASIVLPYALTYAAMPFIIG